MASKDSFVFSERDSVAGSHTVFYDMKTNMFYDMKTKGELIDVSIKTDNGMYAAHRVVLAAAIPYFRTTFTMNLAECTEKEVTVKGIDPVALECLMDFAYTNEVEITAENVQSLLVASDYLQMTKIRDSCCDFLSKRLNLNNVVNVRTLADGLNCVSLAKTADSYIKKNFHAFSQSKEFLQLSFTFLNDVIRKDDLEVSSEKVFDSVINWVKADVKRQNMLPDLLTGVRMTFMSPQFLVQKASKEKLIMDSVPCRNLLDEAKNYHLLQEEGASGSSTACGTYLFFTKKISGLTILKYTTTTRKWNMVLNDKSRSDVRHVLSVDDEIYVFRRNAFETFNPRTLAWKPRETFPSAYSNFNHAISCSGKIHWFGCRTNHERISFDSQQNRWVSYDQNFQLFAEDELVPHGNIVYVLGWRSTFGSPRRYVMYNYDLQTSFLSEISEIPTDLVASSTWILDVTLHKRGETRCIRRFSNRHSGTTSEDEVLRITPIYSSYRERQTVSSMNKPRKNSSLRTYEKRLYANGGTTNDSDVIEIDNPAAFEWTLHTIFSGGQPDFLKGVVISGGKNKAE